MFRKLAALVALSVALPAVALARDPAVAAQRDAAHELRKEDRAVDHLERRWSRAVEKQNAEKLARLDADIHEVSLSELARLRAAGVKTVPEPPRWPDQPLKVLPSKHPRLDQHRDRMVELRALSAHDSQRPADLERTTVLLGQLSDDVHVRREHADHRLDALKG